MYLHVDLPAHAGQHRVTRVKAAQAQAFHFTALHAGSPRDRLLIRPLGVLIVVPLRVVAGAGTHTTSRHVDHRSALLLRWAELGERPATAF